MPGLPARPARPPCPPSLPALCPAPPHPQVVTCSGAGVDGSLRVVRNGIGVVEQALVELPGIKGMWSLRKTFMDAHDAFLVLTFSGETRVLGMNAGGFSAVPCLRAGCARVGQCRTLFAVARL